jgi:hypothetical protein
MDAQQGQQQKAALFGIDMDTAKTGLTVLAAACGLLAAAIHSLGHVNHPLYIDRVAKFLGQADAMARQSAAQADVSQSGA